jgi:hypothetical protein
MKQAVSANISSKKGECYAYNETSKLIMINKEI